MGLSAQSEGMSSFIRGKIDFASWILKRRSVLAFVCVANVYQAQINCRRGWRRASRNANDPEWTWTLEIDISRCFRRIDGSETFHRRFAHFSVVFDKHRAKAFATRQPFPFAPTFSAQCLETFPNFYSFNGCSLQRSHQYSWEAKKSHDKGWWNMCLQTTDVYCGPKEVGTGWNMSYVMENRYFDWIFLKFSSDRHEEEATRPLKHRCYGVYVRDSLARILLRDKPLFSQKELWSFRQDLALILYLILSKRLLSKYAYSTWCG